jgi:GTP-binding protein HflX
MQTMSDRRERFVLGAVRSDKSPLNDNLSQSDSLNELALLVDTAGGQAVATVVQNLRFPHPAHYFGKGKLDEIKSLMDELNTVAPQNGEEDSSPDDASLTVDNVSLAVDDELSATQQRNIEEALNCRVLDRTGIILDIFARHAVTASGKAQVETAQLKYRLSHLTGRGIEMSRLGGGIGTRGPGEKKLETDKRHIRARLAQLGDELKEIARQGEVIRKGRKLPVVSLVGYTNAGKSTLMNRITGSNLPAQDKLFATLDTTIRAASSGRSEFLLADTVGFINKLPHHLIDAFKATLDELKFADILLHVVDVSNTDYVKQMDVVNKTLHDLGIRNEHVITVFNKADKLESALPQAAALPARQDGVIVSAATGLGIDALLELIDKTLQNLRKHVAVIIPYNQGRFVRLIYDGGEVLDEKHLENGTYIEAYVDAETAGRLVGFGRE